METIHSHKFDEIAKKYSISLMLWSLFIMLIGIISLTLSFNADNSNSSLNMFLITFGIIAIIIGLYSMITRAKEDVYLPTGSSTKEGVCFFELNELTEINDELDHKDFNGKHPHHVLKSNGKVRMDYIITKDNRFVAAQLFKFVPYNYEVASGIFYFKDKEAEKFATCLKNKEF